MYTFVVTEQQQAEGRVAKSLGGCMSMSAVSEIFLLKLL